MSTPTDVTPATVAAVQRTRGRVVVTLPPRALRGRHRLELRVPGAPPLRLRLAGGVVRSSR